MWQLRSWILPASTSFQVLTGLQVAKSASIVSKILAFEKGKCCLLVWKQDSRCWPVHIKSLKIWDNKAFILGLVATKFCSGLPGGEVLSPFTLHEGLFLCSPHYCYPIWLDVKYKRGISFYLHVFKMQCPNIMLLERRHLSKKFPRF